MCFVLVAPAHIAYFWCLIVKRSAWMLTWTLVCSWRWSRPVVLSRISGLVAQGFELKGFLVAPIASPHQGTRFYGVLG